MFQDLIVKTIRGVPVYFSEIAGLRTGMKNSARWRSSTDKGRWLWKCASNPEATRSMSPRR